MQVLRQLLERPEPGCGVEEVLAARGAMLPPAAGVQAARFAERVRELSQDERQELFDETFGARSAAHRQLDALLRGLESGTDVGQLVEDLDTTLARDRNPYHHLLMALKAVLRTPAGGLLL